MGFEVRGVIHQVTSGCVTFGQLELDLPGLRYPGLVLELRIHDWWPRCDLSLFAVLIPYVVGCKVDAHVCQQTVTERCCEYEALACASYCALEEMAHWTSWPI